IKAFDMVHARFPRSGGVELWLGESKLYTDTGSAITDAIASVSEHIKKGFLESQKLFLGPQIAKATPHYDELMELFQPQTSLDKFLSSAVFVVGILSDSGAAKVAKKIDASGLPKKIRIALLYVPLSTKAELVAAFDSKLKGLQ